MTAVRHDEDGRIEEAELSRLARDVSESFDAVFSSEIIRELLREIDATRNDVLTLDVCWVGATHPLVDNEDGVETLRSVRPSIIERAAR